MVYVFTDGCPSDASIDEMKALIKDRKEPQMHPITLMSCTNVDGDVKWMKDVEGDAPFTAELDDYVSEKKEVFDEQGHGFPFTRGFWLLCQLVAAINPDDLDALDESVPFTKLTMDNLLGRKITMEEYTYYFNNNPNALKKYAHLFNQFCREDVIAKQIIDAQQTNVNQVFYSQPGNYHPQMWAQNNQQYNNVNVQNTSNQQNTYSW